jgi:hypothetical protein
MLIIMLLTILLSAGQQAVACSSCGSGGADPLILNPYEKQKIYFGLGLQTGFQDIDQHGQQRSSYGPRQKQSLDLAFAQRVSTRAFVSAVANFGRNVHGDESEMQNGDASLNTRFNVLQQNIAEPWIPQIQFIASHRFALGRSIYEQRREHGLDVFGAGYDETYLGADLWYGMSTIMWGVSVLFGRPDAADSEAGAIKPGAMQRWIATAGGMPLDEVKLIGGLIQEKRGAFALEGTKQPDSERRTHDLFLTMETLYPEGSNYRVTLNQRAAWGDNQNAVKATAITLAWMRAL